MERKSISVRDWVAGLVAAGAVMVLAGDTARAAVLQPAAQNQAVAQEAPIGVEELQKRAMQEGESGNAEEAIRDYARALALDPSWKEGRWNLGTLQYGAGRFGDAAETFQQVAGFAPGLGIAWGLLGLSEFEIGRYADSLAHLEKAQSLGIQDDAEVRRVAAYHLALLLIREGEFERASSLLLADFGDTAATPQVKAALGLAILRVPLLPDQVDPSQDALVLAAGDVAASGINQLSRFPGLLAVYPEVPYLHSAYGLALARAGRATEALGAFQEEIRISPSSREAHEALAKALLAVGKKEQAASESRVAAGLADGSSTSPSLIVQRYGNAQAAAKPNEAGNAALGSWQRAMEEYAAGRYSEATGDLKVWLGMHPENGTGWAMLGLCEFSLKDFGNALIHLDRGSQLGLSGSAASIATAKGTFGILLVHAGDFERGSEVLAAVSAEGVPNAAVRYALGLALLRRAEFPGAKEQDLVAVAGEIAILLRQSKYDEAFPQFKRLLAAHPSVPFLHYAYGTALLALSEFEEAGAQMRAEMALSPRSELPLLRLASIALRQRNAQEAKDWAGRALGLAPNSVEGHYLLGRAALELGDNVTAVSELEIANRLDPGSPEVHFNLARAYDRAKLPEKAREERAAFSRLNAVKDGQRSVAGAQVNSGPRDTEEISHPISIKADRSASSALPHP